MKGWNKEVTRSILCFNIQEISSRHGTQFYLNTCYREGWNKEVTSSVGVPLVQGIQAFMDQDYNKEHPIMSHDNYSHRKTLHCETSLLLSRYGRRDGYRV